MSWIHYAKKMYRQIAGLQFTACRFYLNKVSLRSRACHPEGPFQCKSFFKSQSTLKFLLLIKNVCNISYSVILYSEL